MDGAHGVDGAVEEAVEHADLQILETLDGLGDVGGQVFDGLSPGEGDGLAVFDTVKHLARGVGADIVEAHAVSVDERGQHHAADAELILQFALQGLVGLAEAVDLEFHIPQLHGFFDEAGDRRFRYVKILGDLVLRKAELVVLLAGLHHQRPILVVFHADCFFTPGLRILLLLYCTTYRHKNSTGRAKKSAAFAAAGITRL